MGDQMKAKATKEDKGDVQISIRKVKDRVMVTQLMIKKVKNRALVAQIREIAQDAQIRVRALVAQIREIAQVTQIREIAQVAQIRVRMVRANKVAVQNLRKTSLALKELIHFWKI